MSINYWLSGGDIALRIRNIKRKITSLVQSSECIQVTRGANVNQFVFCDATSDRLSEVMKQCAQNVILIIQL